MPTPSPPRRSFLNLVPTGIRARLLRRLSLDFAQQGRADLLLPALQIAPEVASEALGAHVNRIASFSTALAGVSTTRATDFADVVWLFAAHPATRAVARLDLDEAAYLWCLVRTSRARRAVEIGRFRGGSTFLLAAAMGEGGSLVSIDNHSKMPGEVDPAAMDTELRAALERFGLNKNVDVVVADANTRTPDQAGYDLTFLDGDHSYEGVSRDLDRWGSALVPGGHLLLHDAGTLRPLTTVHEGVAKLASELRQGARGGRYRYVGGAGSLLHYVAEKV